MDSCSYCITAERDKLLFHLVIPDQDAVYIIAHTMDEFLSYVISVLGCISEVFEIDGEAEYANVVDEVRAEIGDGLSNPSLIRDIKELQKNYLIKTYSPNKVYSNLRKWNENVL